ncbi:hypothetical protein TSAR_009659 [Trichomalopsis sarcophagae]|uniref:Uncharacterized protein n=1 Tax=Trichomalopsis sarcophagae TaxID=543379 RepID=A0A232ELQ1_9HYME|nr:hypothetical protein TSAR_009659 [Trichomalopsis sarcophagae]
MKDSDHIKDEILAIKEGKFMINEKDDSFFDNNDNNLNDKLQIKLEKCDDITKNTILDKMLYDEETKNCKRELVTVIANVGMDNNETPEYKKGKYEVKEEHENGYDIFSNVIDNSTYDQLQIKSENFYENTDETNNIVTENIFDTGI